jgi:hypothetical protein
VWPVVTLAAIGLAIAGWFLPRPESKSVTPSTPSYTDKEVADAQKAVCETFEKVRHSIQVSGSRDTGNDHLTEVLVALDARQAVVAGSDLLFTKLEEEPATPPDLVTAVRKLGSLYQELAVDYLNDASEAERKPVMHAADNAALTIEGICK